MEFINFVMALSPIVVVLVGIMENGRAAICVTAHAWTGDYCIADHLALYGTYCGT